MTVSAVSHRDLVEASLSNLREHRDTAARWLAIEVLLSDEAVVHPALRSHVDQRGGLAPMTRARQAVSMKDARVLETEVLVSKPKRFVRELVEMPDGYRCD